MKTAFAFTFALLSLVASAQNRLAHPVGGITFQQLAELTGSQAGDDFGASVAVSGNTLVVGVPLASSTCESCGAAYVYTAVNGDWTNLTLVATLTPPTGLGTPGGFGVPVAIDGDTIAVGLQGAGITCVYVNPSGNATATAELATSVVNGGSINGIAVGGSTIVVGMPAALPVGRVEGAAFVYVEPSSGWANMTESAKLISTDEGKGVTAFGSSVGINSRNVVVGATEVSVGGVEQGAAYLFVEPTGGGAELGHRGRRSRRRTEPEKLALGAP